MITKYRYMQNSGQIEPVEFDRETEHYLFRGATKVSKKAGYDRDWYDSYKECYTATLNMLQQDIADMKEMLKMRRDRLANFKANVSRQ